MQIIGAGNASLTMICCSTSRQSGNWIHCTGSIIRRSVYTMDTRKVCEDCARMASRDAAQEVRRKTPTTTDWELSADAAQVVRERLGKR